METISHKKALEQGLKYYFTGKPCKNGNISKRRVNSRSCLCNVCIEKQKRYNNQYKKDNSETLKHYNWKYRKRPEMSDQNRKYKIRYNEKHPHKRYQQRIKRKRDLINRSNKHLDELTDLMLKECYHTKLERELLFGFEWHIDHILPLNGDTVSGLHVVYNLQVIPAYFNLKKGNRIMYISWMEWLAECL